MKFATWERQGSIAIVSLAYPEKNNVLSRDLITDLNQCLEVYEKDSTLRCLILATTGPDFSAGADIKELNGLEPAQINDLLETWQYINLCRKPIIAEVKGYCLGGGLEIALMCDMIIADTSACFGQPEITLGTIPGAGATQRLTASIGKARTMELCLSGRFFKPEEALSWGLINDCVEPESLRAQTLKWAEKIASFSQPVVKIIKDLVKQASEFSLYAGLMNERQRFLEAFSLIDRQEGFSAFLERHHPFFKDD